MSRYLTFLVLLGCLGLQAQQQPTITSMVREVSSGSIRNYILKTVSFGTRHSLGDPMNADRKLGAVHSVGEDGQVSQAMLPMPVRGQ